MSGVVAGAVVDADSGFAAGRPIADPCAGHGSGRATSESDATAGVLPDGNLCEVHCSDVMRTVAVADAPEPLCIGLPVHHEADVLRLAYALPKSLLVLPRTGSPPLLLQFGRRLD